ANDGQRLVHAEAIKAFNELVEARRQRLEAVDYSVPGALWSVVLVGAAISLMGSYVFSMDSLAVHAFMNALLAARIGLIGFFIAATYRPYRGSVSVEPTAYQLVLDDLIHDTSAQ